MKKIILLIILISGSVVLNAQTFTANVSTAKTAYKAGKLEEAHFALQQMLQDIDVTIGKEVLKLLPAKLDTLVSNEREDNVSGNVSFVGATIHRSYGKNDKKAELEIINNSPLIGTLNLFLNSSIGGFMNDGKTKIVKIQGYKARLQQQDNNENGKPSYRLEIPFNNALLSLNVINTTDTEVLNFANTLPLSEIAKLIQ